jgi:hypothetical protein
MVFSTRYTDRGSHYFTTPEVGGKVDKSRQTEVGRALRQLGIDHIAAYSPEARGRSERAFGTLQGRLLNELKLAGITDMAAANRYLREDYPHRHNAQFAIAPEMEASAFVPVPGFDIDNILCIQEDRVVGSDNTVRYKGMILQIPPSPFRHHNVKMRVRVHHYPDDSLASSMALARSDAIEPTVLCMARAETILPRLHSRCETHRTYVVSIYRTSSFALDSHRVNVGAGVGPVYSGVQVVRLRGRRDCEVNGTSVKARRGTRAKDFFAHEVGFGDLRRSAFAASDVGTFGDLPRPGREPAGGMRLVAGQRADRRPDRTIRPWRRAAISHCRADRA